MREVFESIKSSWQSFGLDTVSLVFYWLAIAWFLLYRKDRKNNNIYLYAVFITLLVIGLQAVLAVLGRAPMDKLFYLLPEAILVGYVSVEIFADRIPVKKKWIIILLYAIIIQAGMGWRFTTDYAFANYNDRKISSTVMQMADCIEAVEEIDEPVLLAPEEIATQIQEYDTDIKVAYGEGYHYSEDNLEQLVYEMTTYGCNFAVIKHVYDDEDWMKEQGFTQVIIFDGYSLYYKI